MSFRIVPLPFRPTALFMDSLQSICSWRSFHPYCNFLHPFKTKVLLFALFLDTNIVPSSKIIWFTIEQQRKTTLCSRKLIGISARIQNIFSAISLHTACVDTNMSWFHLIAEAVLTLESSILRRRLLPSPNDLHFITYTTKTSPIF